MGNIIENAIEAVSSFTDHAYEQGWIWYAVILIVLLFIYIIFK